MFISKRGSVVIDDMSGSLIYNGHLPALTLLTVLSFKNMNNSRGTKYFSQMIIKL